MSEERLSDDEVVFRRIPPGSQWFEPPDRISSFNFKLKSDELGLSVYRKSVVAAAEVLAKPEAIAGSLLCLGKGWRYSFINKCKRRILEP